MVARRSARPLAPYARSGTTVPIKKGIRNPAADFARIMAVLKDTGEWPKYRKGVHNLLYSRLSAAKKGDDAKDSYPELALLMDREFPEGQWRVHGRLTRLERLALQGRVVSNSDSDTDGLPLKDHDRAQVEELVGNFILQISIIIHNMRPEGEGFTDKAPAGTKQYVKANGSMSTRILPDLAAAFANLKNADHVTLVLHEVDEGTKQPHDSASYNETDECSRAYQLLSAPPRAGFPEFTKSSSVMLRYGTLNSGYLSKGRRKFNLAKGPKNNKDKTEWNKLKQEWYNKFCRDSPNKEHDSLLLRGVLFYLIHPETMHMYTDGKDFPAAVDPDDQPTVDLIEKVLNVQGVQGMARALMELMPHIIDMEDGDSWLALINYRKGDVHAPGMEFMDPTRSKMRETNDTPTIFFYPNPCKEGGALDLLARGLEPPKMMTRAAAAAAAAAADKAKKKAKVTVPDNQPRITSFFSLKNSSKV